jgi:hypothetical protein
MTHTNPQALLRETLSHYRSLSSYADTGRVTTKLPILRGLAATEVRFETQFSRPNLFRFKFDLPHPFPPLSHIVTTHICGTDGRGAYSWTREHEGDIELEECRDLSMAVAGATGISSGSCYTIADLLLGNLGGRPVFEDVDAAFGDDTVVDDVLCRVIRLASSVERLAVAIDPGSLRVRRLWTSIGGALSEEDRGSIRIDQPIDPRTFERPRGNPGANSA